MQSFILSLYCLLNVVDLICHGVHPNSIWHSPLPITYWYLLLYDTCTKYNYTAFILKATVVFLNYCISECDGQLLRKDNNLNYESEHWEKCKNLTDAEWAQAFEDLLAKLRKQQGFFTKLHSCMDAAIRTSLVISHKTARYKNIMGSLTL